jgi:hypothetical protein
MGPVEKQLRDAKQVLKTHDICTESYARDESGEELFHDYEVCSEQAVTFCAVGALIRVTGAINGTDKARRLLDEAAAEIAQGKTYRGRYSIVALNDDFDCKHTLLAYDRAIELAQERGL